MTRRINLTITFLLIAFISLASSGIAQTSGGSVNEAKVKERVKQYFDANKKVKVTNSFGETLKGRIVKYTDSDFTLRDPKSGTERVFEYAKVSKVQKFGGLSTTTIVTLAAIGAGGAILLGLLGKYCSNEGGC